jgi:hypothetical protein
MRVFRTLAVKAMESSGKQPFVAFHAILDETRRFFSRIFLGQDSQMQMLMIMFCNSRSFLLPAAQEARRYHGVGPRPFRAAWGTAGRSHSMDSATNFMGAESASDQTR